MKQFKKKLLSVMTAAAVFAIVFAGGLCVVAINSEAYDTFTVNPDTGRFYLSGTTAQGGGNVSMEVLKPGVISAQISDTAGEKSEIFDYFRQTEIIAGEYEFSYVMKGVSGQYTLRLLGTDYPGIYEESFNYASPGDILKLIARLKQSDVINAGKAGELIEQTENINLVIANCPLYKVYKDKNADLSSVYENVFAGRAGMSKPSDLVNLIMGPLAARELNAAGDGVAVKTIIDAYGNYFGFESLPAYVFLQAGEQAVIYNKMSSMTGSTIDDWKKNFTFAVVSSVIAGSRSTASVDVVTANSVYLGIDLTKYNNLLNGNSGAALLVGDKLAGKSFATLKELQDTWNSAVDAVNSPSQTTVTSGGGGGFNGVSSFGGVTTVITPDELHNSNYKAPFVDIGGVDWAAEAIGSLYETGVISGITSELFAPNEAVTREQFVKILVGAFGLYDENTEITFEDVSHDEWYYKYVSSAVSVGIVQGISESEFGAGLSITRQDAAVMLARAAVVLGSDLPVAELTFSDGDSIADYAEEAVASLARLEIIRGVDDNMFAPAAPITRAEATVMIYRTTLLFN